MNELSNVSNRIVMSKRKYNLKQRMENFLFHIKAFENIFPRRTSSCVQHISKKNPTEQNSPQMSFGSVLMLTICGCYRSFKVSLHITNVT